MVRKDLLSQWWSDVRDNWFDNQLTGRYTVLASECTPNITGGACYQGTRAPASFLGPNNVQWIRDYIGQLTEPPTLDQHHRCATRASLDSKAGRGDVMQAHLYDKVLSLIQRLPRLQYIIPSTIGIQRSLMATSFPRQYRYVDDILHRRHHRIISIK